MATKFDGGPVGLSTPRSLLGEEPDTIEDVYEPYLLQLGFLQRTPRGRVITKLGLAHVGAGRPRIALLMPDGQIWVPARRSRRSRTSSTVCRRVSSAAKEHGDGQVAVEVELATAPSIGSSPSTTSRGTAFVTLSPYREDGQAEEMIVPVASIAAVTLTPMEEHPPFRVLCT